MRTFASASVTAAVVIAGSFVIGPAASASPDASASPAASASLASPAHSAASPVHRFAQIQPGGPLTIAKGRPASYGRLAERTGNVVSNNWGGYVAVRPGIRFRYIRATFFVPYVDCAASPDSFSGHWVGLDGLGTQTVEQDGIVAACQGTKPVYAAWYEMFPLPPVYSHITIQPGNSIVVSVYYSSATRRFILTLTDTTNGQRFSFSQACASGSTCQRASAEVISEAPASQSTILPLTDFRAEGYSGIRVTIQGGRRGGLRSPWWHTLAVTTENSGGAVLDQPTSIYRGTAFDMYWMRMS